MKCLICKKNVAPSNPCAPFCSDRCRLIDLGNWASEKYGIASVEEPEPEDENAEGDDGV